MQRGDVDADALGNVASPQALEPLLNDQAARGGGNFGPAVVGRRLAGGVAGFDHGRRLYSGPNGFLELQPSATHRR